MRQSPVQPARVRHRSADGLRQAVSVHLCTPARRAVSAPPTTRAAPDDIKSSVKWCLRDSDIVVFDEELASYISSTDWNAVPMEICGQKGHQHSVQGLEIGQRETAQPLSASFEASTSARELRISQPSSSSPSQLRLELEAAQWEVLELRVQLDFAQQVIEAQAAELAAVRHASAGQLPSTMGSHQHLPGHGPTESTPALKSRSSLIAPTDGDSNMAGDGAVISESAHGTLESSLGAPSGPDVSSMNKDLSDIDGSIQDSMIPDQSSTVASGQTLQSHPLAEASLKSHPLLDTSVSCSTELGKANSKRSGRPLASRRKRPASVRQKQNPCP